MKNFSRGSFALVGSMLSAGILFAVPVFAATTGATTHATAVAPLRSPGIHLVGNHIHQDHLFGTVTAVNGSDFTVSSGFNHFTASSTKSLTAKTARNLNAKSVSVTSDAKTQLSAMGVGAKTQASTTVKVGDKVMIMGVQNASGTFSASRIIVLPGAGAAKGMMNGSTNGKFGLNIPA